MTYTYKHDCTYEQAKMRPAVRSRDTTYNPQGAYKQKTLIVRQNFTKKFFFYVHTVDRATLLAVLISPPERLDEVCHHAISCSPPPAPSRRSPG